jgi:hypothetical protein
MRKAIAVAILFAAIGLSLNVKAQSAYDVYSQTTRTCNLGVCSNAQFTPEATLSYAFDFTYYGQKNVSGEVTWNGTTYTDAVGSLVFEGYGNHYPFGEWDLVYTFNGNHDSGREVFYCFRSCGSNSNKSGEVVVSQ